MSKNTIILPIILAVLVLLTACQDGQFVLPGVGESPVAEPTLAAEPEPVEAEPVVAELVEAVPSTDSGSEGAGPGSACGRN